MLTFLLFLIFAPLSLMLFVLLVLQFLKLFAKPSFLKDWTPLHKLLPKIEINQKSGEVYIKNVRDVKYLDEFDWQDEHFFFNKKYNLNELSKVWLLVNPYGFLQSHVILSFQFGEGLEISKFLTISYEVRKNDLFDYKAYKPILKRYEGFYLVATEEDALHLRTNIRKSEINYLFSLEATSQQIKSLFLNLAEEINLYHSKPYFYKIFSRNCLTEILKHLREENILNYRSYDLFNIPKLMYKNSNKKLKFKEYLKTNEVHIPKNVLPTPAYSINLRNALIHNANL